MASRDLKVRIVGDDDTSRAFGSAHRNADGFGHKIGRIGAGIGMAFGGVAVAGIAGLSAGLVSGVRSAASYEQITNQLAQTLKSTGNAAGQSVEGLKEYAGSLESMSGVDEELILSSQNVLATFTKVQNKVGEGNDIFDQASLAALNLSTTMGGDLQGATVMVGKALNDPIKGITALQKAGVQLTEQQKEQIKTMVASGDTMGAQKIILGELETQFGGAAAAAGSGLTGTIARLKDTFGDLFRTLAENILPTVGRVAEGLRIFFVALSGGSEIDEFDGKLRTLNNAGIKAREIFDAVRDALWTFWMAFQGEYAAGEFEGAMRRVYQAGAIVRTAFDAIAGFLRDVLPPIFSTVASIFDKAGDDSAGLGNRFSEFYLKAKEIFERLRDTIKTIIEAIRVAWETWGRTLTEYAVATFKNLMSVVDGALKVIKGVFDVFVGVLTGDWSRAWDGIKGIVGGAWDVIKGLVSQALNVVQTGIKMALDAIFGDWRSKWESIKTSTSSALDGVVGFVAGLPGRVLGALAGLPGALSGAAAAAWGAYTGAVNSAVGTMLGVVTSIPGRVTGALGNLGGLLVNAGRSIVQGLIDGMQDKFGALAKKASELAQKVKDFLPFSPAKKGPFSGKGNPYYSGLSIGRLLEQGLNDSMPTLGGAMNRGTGALSASLTAAPLPVASGAGTSRLEALLMEQNALLRSLPREYRLNSRQTPELV